MPNPEVSTTEEKTSIAPAILFVPTLILGMIAALLGLSILGVPLLIASGLSIVLGGFATVLVITRLGSTTLGTTSKEFLRLNKPSVRSMISAFSVGVVLYFLLQIVALPFALSGHVVESETSQSFFASSGASLVILAFIITPLLAPIVEELAFRGAFITSLEKAFGRFKKTSVIAVIISAFVFSLFHFQGFSTPIDFITLGTTFIVGITSGIYALKTNSIWPSVLIHVTYNSVTVFMSMVLPALI